MKTLRLAVLIAVLCSVANPAAIHTLTITGTSTTQVVSSTIAFGASWVQLVAPAGNSSTSRVGDSTITSTTGIPLAPGAGMMLPYVGVGSYSLRQLNTYVATGDTLSVTWAY